MFTAGSATHRPTHDLLKIRSIVIWNLELPELIRQAKAAIARADEVFKAAESSTMPSCSSCSGAVRYPFFVCLGCAGTPSTHVRRVRADLRSPIGSSQDVYICATCDQQIGGVSVGAHIPQHTLVRCLSPAERSSERSEGVEERLRALEDKVASYSERMSRMELLLEGISSALSRIAPP